MKGHLFASRKELPRFTLALLLAVLVSIPPAGLAEDPPAHNREYGLHYQLTPIPDKQAVDVRVILRQDRHLFREMRFDADRVRDLAGDGEFKVEDGEAVWRPPAAGGELRWRASAVHARSKGGHDAWLDTDWGLFRAEDVIPRAATRTLRDARSRTTFQFALPRGWSAVTEFREVDGKFRVTSPGRRFVQPSGWIVIGKLGVRRERIAGTRVAVAAPIGEDVRRLDILALLNWTLPELARILPTPLPRLTIVSAGEPMWRGGLSAPQSFYIHADRPLISENGTSTLLHEVMHVAMGATAEPGYDWIIEGLAEYYSLQLLYRSGSITPARYREALSKLADWSKNARSLCGRSSSGSETALAVTVMHALDREIADASGGKDSLDDVVAELLKSDRRMALAPLRASAGKLIGRNPNALHSRRLPGCDKVQAETER